MPENQSGGFRAARTQKPRQPNHFTGAYGQVERLHDATLSVISEGDDRLMVTAGRWLRCSASAASSRPSIMDTSSSRGS